MLDRSFIHVRGIGYQSERRLWDEGAESWHAFLANPTGYSIARARLAATLDVVSRSPKAVARGDYRFFAERLPSREHWRALDAFPGRVIFLDIESDGGMECDAVTVIGTYDGETLRHFIRGENLLEFEEALGQAAMLVTFNGASFDLPVLRCAFPRLRLDQLHLDLCPALRRLGLAGGLKKIERAAGLRRSAETAGLIGWDAVRLWQEWRWGSEEARRVLLAYNSEDVMNMVPLSRLAFSGLSAQTLAARADA